MNKFQKNAPKKNKTVVEYKTKLKAGSFTTIPNNIINDKRLNANSKLLLISILSDSEGFKLSPNLYQNRLGLSKSTFLRCMSELESLGYIRKSKINKTQYNHYTISVYGNLNSQDKLDENNVEETEEITSSEYQEEIESKIKNILNTNEYLFHFDSVHFDSKLHKEIGNILDASGASKDSLIKINNKFKQFQTNIFNHYHKKIKDKKMDDKNKKEAIKLLKIEIYENKNLNVDTHKLINKASQTLRKNKIKRYGYDFETAELERYENPLD